MKKSKKVRKESSSSGYKSLKLFIDSYLIYFIIVVFASLYAFISIIKYNHFQTGLDLAIYVQQYYFYLHGMLPHVTLWPTLGDLAWADHFSPSLILLTPFYFLWPDPKVLLILQPFLYLSGAYAIWSVAKEKMGNIFFAYALAISFCLFFGVQFPLTFDFHETTMAAATMAWILWAMEKKRWKTFLVFAVIGMGFKEDMPLYIFTLGVYLVLSRRNWKLGIPLSIAALAWFIYLTHVIMPGLHHIGAKTESTSFFSFTPEYLFATFFDSPIKIQTMFLCFLAFLFIPLFSGWYLLLPFAHFLINFADHAFPGRWGIFLHYRGYIAAILSFGFIYGYMRLEKWFPNIFVKTRTKIAVGSILLLMAFSLDFMLHLPLNALTKKQLYFTEPWIKNNNEVIKAIPQNGVLLTQNSLAPQVSFRQYVYYYPQHINKADYIFLDLHPDPIHEEINFWLSEYFSNSSTDAYIAKINGKDNKIKASVDYLISQKEFVVVKQSGDAILLRRNGDKK